MRCITYVFCLLTLQDDEVIFSLDKAKESVRWGAYDFPTPLLVSPTH
ncbi:MAG: hypothetical protein AAGK47_02935 [Bacteroidota bacterium]